MKFYKWTRLAVLTGLVIWIASGCSLSGNKEHSQSIDPPPTDADTSANAAKAASGSAIRNPSSVTVYARDNNGFIAPIGITVEKSVDIAKKALEAMVEDGPAAGQMPSGFTAVIPKGTSVKGINLVKDQKLAVVDFSKSFTDYNLQDERKMMEAITWTMTGFPTVDKVKFRVEGKDLKEMPLGGTPLDEPLTRTMGINLEKLDGVEYGQSTAVTIYFIGQNKDNYKYYVPVTRMVKRTDNIAQAVVEQLIAGPDQKKGLHAVMNPGAELRQVKNANDVITVDFTEKMLGADKKAPADALKSIVLSLTENAGTATKVQITVNGEAKVRSTDNQSYSQPVGRPSSINVMKM
jgi:germination protein M